MQSSPKLGIVVLSYNHPEITAKCVRSALVFSPDVYLVHNGSLSNHRARLQKDFPQIQHLSLEQNRGYSGGVNFGLTQAFANHDWLLLLTNDCRLENLPTLPEQPQLVAPHILIGTTSRTDSLGGSFNARKARLTHCKTIEEFKSAKNPYIPGSAFLVHRDFWTQIGGFDEKLGTYWEDVDLSLRARDLGLTLSVQENWRVRHARGKTCHKHRHYTLYLFQRNRKRVALRRLSGVPKLLLAAHLCGSWLRQALFLFTCGRREDLPLLWRAIRQ